MTTINKSQLLAILRYLNAPSNTYDLGTNIRADVCYDIEHTERGWETFLIERTSRFEVAVFDTETDACLHAVWNRALAKKIISKRLSIFVSSTPFLSICKCRKRCTISAAI